MRGRIVVVGGSLGGLRAAEQLRGAGWTGELLVLGAETHLPYQRPPLSKSVLTDPDVDALSPAAVAGRPAVALRRRASTGDVTWRTATPVVSADLTGCVLTTATGQRIGYDALVVATGIRPRRLDVPGFHPSRHVVRTVEDATGLRRRLRPGTRVVIVGGGFIGCEVAASARTLGCRVTVVDPLPAPMLTQLGHTLAGALQAAHESRGVRFLLERSVLALTAEPSRWRTPAGVLLDDGEVVEADVLVEAVGSVPNVEWLAGNGLDLTNGVLCDNDLRALGADRVVAVGDVARFPNPRFDPVPRRVEHWCVPTDTAQRAARTLLHTLHPGTPVAPGAFAPLPSFWSDQYHLRLQGFGALSVADRIEVLHGAAAPGWDRDGLVVGHYRGERLVGAVVAGGPPALRMRHQQLVQEANPAPQAGEVADVAETA